MDTSAPEKLNVHGGRISDSELIGDKTLPAGATIKTQHYNIVLNTKALIVQNNPGVFVSVEFPKEGYPWKGA